MSLKRLTPTTRDLGYLRLWQEDIEEIVLFVRQQLSNETIVLESDGNELTDAAADLPKLGRRVQYFIIKVTGKPEEGGEGPREILTVTFTRERCKIDATNPDAGTRGVISDIQDIAQKRRRLPLWYPHLGMFTRPQTAVSAQMAVLQLVWMLLFVGSLFGTALCALAASNTVTVGTNPKLSLAGSLAILVPCAIFSLWIFVGEGISRTVLFTGTRKDAPTFWQQNRTNIVISVVVAAVFYLLGLWTASG